ncbi:MAG: ABC transporter permease [Muribaculaceae bacterium]|nr:ABC transporter permease [Muribaculaceae bacterium]
MNTLSAIIKKESLQILRDRRTAAIIILIPMVLLLLFGFAISTEVKQVRVAAAIERPTDQTRLIIQRLDNNEYLRFEGMVTQPEIEPLLRQGAIDAALVIADNGSSQIIVDAANPTIAQSATVYLRSAINPAAGAPVEMRTLYNPQMLSAYNFGPGIMGTIFILVCAMMTSISIVGEKETGTMNLLLVSPVKPRTIIFGKLIPYFAIACIILAIMLTLGYSVLQLPLSSSVFSVILVSMVYICLSLSIGLLVSTLTDSRMVALLISGMVFMMPIIMLSGMIYPVDNMPKALQAFSTIIPARWYIAAMRKLMIQQLPLSRVLTELAILLAMTALILTIAIRKFKK